MFKIQITWKNANNQHSKNRNITGTKKAYNLERFVGGGITQAEWSIFPEITPETSIIDAVSARAEFPLKKIIKIKKKKV